MVSLPQWMVPTQAAVPVQAGTQSLREQLPALGLRSEVPATAMAARVGMAVTRRRMGQMVSLLAAGVAAAAGNWPTPASQAGQGPTAG